MIHSGARLVIGRACVLVGPQHTRFHSLISPAQNLAPKDGKTAKWQQPYPR